MIFGCSSEICFGLADKAFLAKQKDMLRLYKHVNQESYYKDHIDIAKSWQIKDNVNAYTVSLASSAFLFLT